MEGGWTVLRQGEVLKEPEPSSALIQAHPWGVRSNAHRGVSVPQAREFGWVGLNTTLQAKLNRCLMAERQLRRSSPRSGFNIRPTCYQLYSNYTLLGLELESLNSPLMINSFISAWSCAPFGLSPLRT